MRKTAAAALALSTLVLAAAGTGGAATVSGSTLTRAEEPVVVFDGGADGLASTSGGNTPFARQGVFVP